MKITTRTVFQKFGAFVRDKSENNIKSGIVNKKLWFVPERQYGF